MWNALVNVIRVEGFVRDAEKSTNLYQQIGSTFKKKTHNWAIYRYAFGENISVDVIIL